MAYDKKPSTWLGAGYANDASAHTITLQTAGAASNKTLPDLTDAQANPTTGDAVNIIEAFNEALFQHYNGLGADAPAHIRIYRASQTDDATGVVTRTYTVQIDGAGAFTPTTG